MIRLRRGIASAALHPQWASFKPPRCINEPMRSYAPGSAERAKLKAALKELRAELPVAVPLVINGERFFAPPRAATQLQRCPQEHSLAVAQCGVASREQCAAAVAGALAAKAKWEALPFHERAAVFLKAAARLSSDEWRYRLLAATMLGQGKNAWQAEIDAAAELADFWRFNVEFARQIYEMQPPENAPDTWNRLEFRPLEGFVYAVSPFNFTAIGGNLCSAPALMGNAVVWKPSPGALLSNYLVYRILEESGLPPGVIQFLPGDAETVTSELLAHRDFAGLHFTGSSEVFRRLWAQAGANLHRYRNFPRVVGETGGKNMHFVHASADAGSAARQTVRGAFEYAGQKCSATSRAYVADSLWDEFRAALLAAHAELAHGGPVEDFRNFVGAVIHEASFDKLAAYIDRARKAQDARIIAGGKYNKEKGYFVEPTIILTTNPDYETMADELFGPVLTVFVYPAGEYAQWLQRASDTSAYALTASIFARDRDAIAEASYRLRDAAGNFYINDKSTGAVVGQQPFGGARGSGTNDKAGSPLNLFRWVSGRTIKESFVGLADVRYPSNAAE